MSGIKFLVAAYVATWLIHGSYLAHLMRSFKRLRSELKELSKK